MRPITRRGFSRAAAPAAEYPAAVTGGTLLPGARQHRNGATLNAAPKSAASHPHTKIPVPQMQQEVTPGKGKKKEKICQQQE